MAQKFSKKVINNLLGIDETYRAPDKLMEILLNKEQRKKLFSAFLEISTDMSFDWFQEYFEEEQAERKSQKQDYTPAEVSILVSMLAGNGNSTVDYSAGTGSMIIQKWRQDCLHDHFLTYKPHNYLYYCEELSDRSDSFFNF